jgi:hypothetical protein
MCLAGPKETSEDTDASFLIADDNLEGHTQHLFKVLTLAYCRIICESD